MGSDPRRLCDPLDGPILRRHQRQHKFVSYHLIFFVSLLQRSKADFPSHLAVSVLAARRVADWHGGQSVLIQLDEGLKSRRRSQPERDAFPRGPNDFELDMARFDGF